MTNELNHQENLSIMNSILLGYEYIESLDKIKETRYYRQNIKQQVNSLTVTLEKTNALKELWGIEDNALMEAMRGKERLMKKLAIVRPELKIGLDMILEKFFDNPVATLNKMGIDVEVETNAIN